MVDLHKLLLISLIAGTFACKGTLEPIGGDGDGDGDNGGEVDAAIPSAGEMEFINNVVPLLNAGRVDGEGSCTGCHAGLVPDFLGADPATTGYSTAVAYVGGKLFSDPADMSLILMKGEHNAGTAKAWCTGVETPDLYCTIDEVAIVTAWINTEIAAGTISP